MNTCINFSSLSLSLLFPYMVTEHAFAFVFREVLRPSSSAEEVAVKRKAGI